jgi:hypothetical protein
MDYIFMLAILVIIVLLYNSYETKKLRANEDDNQYSFIQKYLLGRDDDDVAHKIKSMKKPIIWIYIDYDYNSRNWLNFGSRSSYDLNIPFIFLSVKSIIQHCGDDFNICLIDCNSFYKLIPNWKLDINKTASPVKDYIVQLGLCRLLYMYGGINVPCSFICTKSLKSIWDANECFAFQSNKMHLDAVSPYIDNINFNGSLDSITAINSSIGGQNFSQNYAVGGEAETNKHSVLIGFMGCRKKNACMNDFIDFIELNISIDYTAENKFLMKYSNWLLEQADKKRIKILDGKLIGVCDIEDNPVEIDDLLGFDYIDIYPNKYGLYVPIGDILKRTKYEYFTRMSALQILESHMIISKYIISSLGSAIDLNREEYKNEKEFNKKIRNKYVGFWTVPTSTVPVYGLKPQPFGGYIIKSHETKPKP